MLRQGTRDGPEPARVTSDEHPVNEIVANGDHLRLLYNRPLIIWRVGIAQKNDSRGFQSPKPNNENTLCISWHCPKRPSLILDTGKWS